MIPEIATKGQFAALVQRDAAFVSRAISSGKICGEALVGEGRSARIRVAVAMEQLGRALDFSQQMAQGRPILGGDRAPALEMGVGVEKPTPGPSLGKGGEQREEDSAPSSQIHAMKEEQLDLRNRRLRIDLEKAERDSRAAAGELVLASEVAAAVRRQLGLLLATFDEVPAAVARAMSEQHGVNYAEALITTKAALRVQRTAWAERARGLGAMAGAQEVVA